MTRLRFFQIALLFLLTAFLWQLPANAAEPKLEGFYFLNDDNCVKGANKENCKINLQIFGQAARVLYENMKAKPVADGCSEGMAKTDASGLHCFIGSDKRYGCDLGYNFARAKVVGSDVSC